jgi:hypothetical protein
MRSLAFLVALAGAGCSTGFGSGATYDPALARVVVCGELPHAIELTADELAKMPRVSETVQERDQQELVEGVLMSDVLRRAGAPLEQALRGKALELYVVVEGADGVRAVFGLAELDPGMTDERILLIDRKDGQPLAEGEGPLRLVVPADKRHARWVRQVVRIVVGRVP